MLKINKNKINTLYVTVTELTTISDAEYLMKLTSNSTNEIKVVRLGDDLTTNPQRYNVFQLTEDIIDNENLEDGIINLQVGTYDYEIYQTESPTGTTLTSIEDRIESGLVEVYGVGGTPSIFDDNDKIIIFE